MVNRIAQLARAKERLARRDNAANAMTHALNLPPDAKHLVFAKMYSDPALTPATAHDLATTPVRATGGRSAAAERVFQWVGSNTQFMQQFRLFIAGATRPSGFTLVPTNFGHRDTEIVQEPIGVLGPVEIYLIDPDPSAEMVTLRFLLQESSPVRSVTILLYRATIATPASTDDFWDDALDDDHDDGFERDETVRHRLVLPTLDGKNQDEVRLARTEFAAGQIEVEG